MMVDVSKNFGMEGEYSLSLNFTLPTGQYDIKRGSDFRMYYLQPRSSAAAAPMPRRSIDTDNGHRNRLWIFERITTILSRSTFYGKNQFSMMRKINYTN